MSEPRIKRIEVPWHQFFKRVKGLETAPRSDPLINKIIVYPEIIPIIFVPGIMGSRLLITESQDKAWDPDALGFMGFRYGIRGTREKRKTILVGNASHKADHLAVDKDIGKAPSGKVASGWGSIAWKFYGDILESMSTHQWPFPLNICFKRRQRSLFCVGIPGTAEFGAFSQYTNRHKGPGRQLGRKTRPVGCRARLHAPCRPMSVSAAPGR